jgi:8-oxo-dGTP pyrophosphatase MutT (NUDIX family)
VIIAAGVILRSPSGRVLLLQRSGEGDHAGEWAFPGGKLEPGEDVATAVVRETLEETGYRLGTAGDLLMRSVNADVDFTTLVREVDEEFTPRLNGEHVAFAWVDPKMVDPVVPVATIPGPGVRES